MALQDAVLGEEKLVSVSGGEAIARMFKAFNVGPMFGMGGFQLLPFYDAARRLGLNHNLIDDERTGIFAADAYAKVSRRVGVVDATLGPGATNLVTGLVEALNAGSPIVALVGDSHRAHSWKNMTQETRQTDVLAPVCKELIRIERADRIPELIRRAFAVATSGRPGPVVVDVPEDVAHEICEFDLDEFYGVVDCESVPAIRSRPNSTHVAAAALILAQAERPVVLAGGGVHISGAAEALTSFANEFDVPVAHTLTGKGAIPCTDPHSIGLFGRYERIANGVIDDADAILVVGCKLGEIATKRYTIPNAKATVIHLDLVAEEFGRTLTPTIALWGDALLGIDDLTEQMRALVRELHVDRADYIRELVERMQQWEAEAESRRNSDEVPINMARLMQEINRALPADGYLIADGGFAAHWGGLLFDTRQAGRQFVPDRGFASIGYGVPGAIGVASADSNRHVVAITGDAGFNMSVGALETARRMGLTFAVIVVNNAASGYVKALQHLSYGPGAYHASDLLELDYATIARSYGCHGIRVEEPGDLLAALTEALATEGPTVIDVVVTRDPGKMLPGVDSRVATMAPGDRIA